MHTSKTALLSLVTAAFALPATALAGDGWYVAGGLGSAELSEDFDGFDVDSDATALKLVVGWRLNENFGVEFGYQDFGDFEQTFDLPGGPAEVSLTADGFTIGVSGALPVSDRFALTGRLGLFFWNGAATINGVGAASPDDRNLYVGAGAKYSLTDNFALTGDWSRFELEETESGVFSVGFEYSFRD